MANARHFYEALKRILTPKKALQIKSELYLDRQPSRLSSETTDLFLNIAVGCGYTDLLHALFKHEVNASDIKLFYLENERIALLTRRNLYIEYIEVFLQLWKSIDVSLYVIFRAIYPIKEKIKLQNNHDAVTELLEYEALQLREVVKANELTFELGSHYLKECIHIQHIQHQIHRLKTEIAAHKEILKGGMGKEKIGHAKTLAELCQFLSKNKILTDKASILFCRELVNQTYYVTPELLKLAYDAKQDQTFAYLFSIVMIEDRKVGGLLRKVDRPSLIPTILNYAIEHHNPTAIINLAEARIDLFEKDANGYSIWRKLFHDATRNLSFFDTTSFSLHKAEHFTFLLRLAEECLLPAYEENRSLSSYHKEVLEKLRAEYEEADLGKKRVMEEILVRVSAAIATGNDCELKLYLEMHSGLGFRPST